MSIWRVMYNLERLQSLMPVILNLINIDELGEIKIERHKNDTVIVIRLFNVEGVEYARITVEKKT